MGEQPSTVPEPAAFREAMSHFASGVVVVTAVVDGVPVGMTCQSFASLSLDPPLVLFCPARSSRSWPALRSASRLCVNVLSSAQEGVSAQFARSGTDKFAGVAWSPTPAGAPALAGVAAHLEVSVQDVVDGGDHHIVVCRVHALETDPSLTPLVYWRSGYRTIEEHV